MPFVRTLPLVLLPSIASSILQPLQPSYHLATTPRAPLPHLPVLTISEVPDSGVLARGLGYLVGAGSLLLYTPIAIRVCRQRDASGLTLSTWWLKLLSYTCSDCYSFSKHYPISTYTETLIVTVEAAVVLVLVATYQRRLDASLGVLALGYALVLAWALAAAPPAALALGQTAATIFNSAALLPQLLLNYQQQSPGGYSPLTASLACVGCLIRLFTTVELAGSDPLLLAGFACGLLFNGALLAQIVWFGSVVEGRPLVEVLTADFGDYGGSGSGDREMDEEMQPMKQ